MKIGVFPKCVGLPISTLHFYERKGLLSPHRSSAGHREYGESDVAWVAFIERLKQTGMPLAQIKMYADLRAKGDDTLEERMMILIEHREGVLSEISKWNINLAHLEEKVS